MQKRCKMKLKKNISKQTLALKLSTLLFGAVDLLTFSETRFKIIFLYVSVVQLAVSYVAISYPLTPTDCCE